MDRPKPVSPGVAPAYPTLSEFTLRRRELLRGLAVGAASVGVSVLLPGCLSERSAGAGRGRAEDPDGGGQGSDAGRPGPEPDGGSPDTGDEPPSPGGEPSPHYYEVRLPTEDFFHTYLRDDAYLGFALALRTYDEGLAQFYQDYPATGLSAASKALQGQTCEDMTAPERIAANEAMLQALLEREYADDTGNTAPLEALELLVGFCEDEVPMGGDAPEPRYPGRPPR